LGGEDLSKVGKRENEQAAIEAVSKLQGDALNGHLGEFIVKSMRGNGKGAAGQVARKEGVFQKSGPKERDNPNFGKKRKPFD